MDQDYRWARCHFPSPCSVIGVPRSVSRTSYLRDITRSCDTSRPAVWRRGVTTDVRSGCRHHRLLPPREPGGTVTAASTCKRAVGNNGTVLSPGLTVPPIIPIRRWLDGRGPSLTATIFPSRCTGRGNVLSESRTVLGRSVVGPGHQAINHSITVFRRLAMHVA